MKIHTLANIFKNYRWQSFLAKNFIMIFSIIIFPMAIFSFVIFRNYRQNMISSIEHSNSNSTLLLSDYLDRQFDEIESFFINIKSSNLYSMDFNMLTTAKNINDDPVVDSFKNISNYIERFLIDNKTISSVYLYCENSGYVFSFGFPNSNYLQNFHDAKVITDNNQIYNYPYFRSVQINRTGYNMLSIVYPVDSSKIVFNININVLKETLTGIDANLQQFYITNSDNMLLYSEDERYNVFTDGSALINDNFKIDSENNTVTCTASKTSSIKYIFSNHYPEYSHIRHSYVYTLILLILLVLSLTIGISIVLTVRLYKHILSLIDILHPYISPDENDASDELQLITNSILNITSQNSDLREELSLRLNALKTAQASMLQVQINPHFLYNTLNSINSIVMFTFKKETQVSDIITNLSEILRYSSNASEYLVPLETELYYLKKYIDIQSAKYVNRFKLEYNINEKTKDMKLIKLSLQPLVENAIIHGILPKRTFGTIYVSSEICKNSLVIKVTDDGIGIPEARLNELNEKIKNDVFVLDKSLGIENTSKRIRLIFGNSYGLNIQSSDKGTTIILTVPIIE